MNPRDSASRLNPLLATLPFAPRTFAAWTLAACTFTALTLAPPCAFAAEPPAPATTGTGAASPLASLAWLSGSWVGTQGEMTTEEHWTDASGGLMLGMNRARRGGRAVMFEFLRIVARGDSISYVALPRGRNETPFPMKELSGKRVVFENPAHDFPQRIIYWQDKPGELHARTEGLMDGKVVSEEWIWKRVKAVK